jgi:hypothetical protein
MPRRRKRKTNAAAELVAAFRFAFGVTALMLLAIGCVVGLAVSACFDVGSGAFHYGAARQWRGWKTSRRAWWRVGNGLRALRRKTPRIRVAALAAYQVLTPTEFEAAIATLLEDVGYSRVQVTGGAGDLAADICCVDPEGRRTVVQCKRYAPSRLVGSRDLQLFIGMAFTHHAANRAIYATTSGFTAPATQLARQHGVELWDGSVLSRMLRAPTAER